MGAPIGVVVGRFHIPQPHNGHRTLVRHVLDLHEEVVVILGESAGFPNERNPLPFSVRKMMMLREFPGITVLPLRDVRDDSVWSDMLDAAIAETFPGRPAVLYGSRDSFIGSYSGRYETVQIQEANKSSASAVRERIRERPSVGAAFRKGIIYAMMTRPPITYPTVDVAVLNYDTRSVLLGRKPHDPPGKYRFIGGFVDPTDPSYEAAAHRERSEEAGDLGLTPLEYVGSHRVDDWRYRGTKDGIMTILFRAGYIFGRPEPKDDIVALKWARYEDEMMEILVEEHLPLGEKLRASLVASGHLANESQPEHA